ncbi:MAG: DNRLRE domain-containing protein [Bacteroidetes bacterium]|nr:DNRLRE domain-containing protein [Bacteroidota bacterium]
MKNIYSLCLLVLFSFSTPAQTTTTFTINANDEDATIDDYNSGGNYPGEIDMVSRAWTISSVPVVWRSVFKFDLSCIPSNAIIQNASLSLYYATQNSYGNQQHESLTNSDESVVQRITSAWTENTVTWNNQPSTTSADQLILPQSTSGTQDYLNMNVTAMVQQMVGSVNNGFLMKLTNEAYYANLIFASGDNPDSSKHPQLVVTYTVPGISCVTLRMDQGSQDATVDDYNAGGNYPNEIDMVSRAWTISSVPVVWRSLFKFDFPCSMAGATVQSAHLSLYYAAQNSYGNQQHESLTNSDESVVQRITSTWTANTVTWNNQPSTTNADQVILPQSTSGTEDYTNYDVTGMVQQMVNSNNNGFLIKLTNEAYYANLIFASGDNPDTSKHAKLEICYSIPSGVNEIKSEDGLLVYPVPSCGLFTIENKNRSEEKVEIVNVLGESVYPSFMLGAHQMKTINDKLKAGIYFIIVENATGRQVKKLICQ